MGTHSKSGPLTRRLEQWARRYMERRPPDVTIGNRYLLRWHVIRKNRVFNIYLHRVIQSDDDRALHDHPWVSLSWILSGSYRERMVSGSRILETGDRAMRGARTAHRLEVVSSPVISLFITGPKVREWGFHCPQGWRHWADFLDPSDNGKTGRGCE